MNLLDRSLVVTNVNYEFAGLPLHVLLVHAVVILMPLAAIAVVLHAILPAARRRLGAVTPIAALIVLVLVPITVAAGEHLKTLVVVTPAVERHEELGRTLLPWAIALFVVAVADWVWFRFFVGPTSELQVSSMLRRVVLIVLIVASVVVATGSIVDVVLIGEAGSRAVWGGLVGAG